MKRQRSRRERADAGQVVVLFALAFTVLAAMVGLVLDGSGAFAQRRAEQNAADVAALAGANDYLLNRDVTSAVTRAKAIAAFNGYTDGTGGTGVAVNVDTANGAMVHVAVTSPHRNGFASIVGMRTWQVGASATALAGFGDRAVAAAPMIFNAKAFLAGKPLAAYGDPAHPFAFGEGNGDAPNNADDLAWTNYGTGNVNTSDVRQMIQGTKVVSPTFDFGDYIGQHNNGFHNALFDDVDTYLSGKDVVVPIVDDAGNYQGWATFHVVSAAGGSSKTVTGYFRSDFVSQLLTVGSCPSGNCPRYFGTYVLKLVE